MANFGHSVPAVGSSSGPARMTRSRARQEREEREPPTLWRGGPLEPGGARERQSPPVRQTPWRGGPLEPGRLNNRPPHPNGVVYQYSTGLIQLRSTLDMSTSVPIAMPGYYRRRTSRSVAVKGRLPSRHSVSCPKDGKICF